MRYFFKPRDVPHALPGIVAALGLALMAMTSSGIAAEDGAEAKPTPPAADTAGRPINPTSPGVAAEDAAAPKPAPPAVKNASPPINPASSGTAAKDGLKPASKATSKGKSKVRAKSVAGTAAIDAESLLAAQLRLGSNLVEKLASNRAAQANVIVSPASLAMVFSFLDMGAGDQMRAAIHRTLGFGDAQEAIKRDIEGVRSIATSTLRRGREGGPLALANIIVFDPASQPYQPALHRLQAAGAEVSVEDLSKPQTIARINNWVKERTGGLIPAVIEDAPQDPGLVAVNALYFKDRWKSPFDPAGTRDQKFHISLNQSIDVPMMRSEGRFAFRQDSKFVAVELSYASEDYQLVIVTSKDAPLGVNEFAGAVGWLGGQGFEMTAGEVAMPRFSASGSEDLLPAVDALGLGSARKAAGALKGFTATTQTISRVVQKTELRVNEEGTEAAAATAVTTMRSAMASPAQYVKMIVDKPFVFALRDKQAGLVLLLGYVAKPAAMTEPTAR
jgi:serpin B